MDFKIILLFCLLVTLQSGGEGSTIRSNFMENISTGLKLAETLLGKNYHRQRHQFYNGRSPPGVSTKSDLVAELVSQSFSPQKETTNRNNIKQDSIVYGQDTPSLPDNHFMSGMMKLFGFDSSKIGAAALNGIIFIAQMVRYGANSLMDFMMTKTWDWYKIIELISERIKNDTVNTTSESIEPTESTPGRFGNKRAFRL